MYCYLNICRRKRGVLNWQILLNIGTLKQLWSGFQRDKEPLSVTKFGENHDNGAAAMPQQQQKWRDSNGIAKTAQQQCCSNNAAATTPQPQHQWHGNSGAATMAR